ncbi:DMT family transporter [Paramixta manurensis]|uniref:DMT family transporter n=1 Tax=Paramixta manurensis TaxID=2740817 RepID=A0A6M8UC52_9GAMM|nr:DMT family transporter [Erwiniaceae bacterium PD-1]
MSKIDLLQAEKTSSIQRVRGCLAHCLPEALLVLAWSSGFVGIRLSSDYAPVFLVLFWRCALVVALMLPLVWRELIRTPINVLLTQGSIGLLAMSGYLAGVGKGIEYGVPAGLAALMADLLPVGSALLGVLFLHSRPSVSTWLGLVLGVAGVVIVTWGVLSWGNAAPWAYGLPLLGMFSLACATLLQKKINTSAAISLPGVLWLQCAVSLVAFGGAIVPTGSLTPIFSSGFIISVLWTALFSTLGGYGLYWFCLKRTSPVRVGSVLYLSPAVTLLWSWFMFGEPLSWSMLAGVLVSGGGLWLVIRAQ